MPTVPAGQVALTCRLFGHRYYCGSEDTVYQCTRAWCQASLRASTPEELEAAGFLS